MKVAAVGVVLMFAALALAPAYARDAGSSNSDWEPLDRVLIIPPVYKPAARGKAPATIDVPAGSEDCSAAPLNAGADGSIAAAGTADCANTDASGTQARGSTAEPGAAADSTRQAAADPAQADTGGVDPSIGTIDDYQQQEAAAEEAAAVGIGQMPVVVGPPLVPYYLPRTYAAPAPPMTHIYVPSYAASSAFPLTPRATWMPQPTAPMVMAPPAWMPQPTVPMVAAPAPMFAPRAFGSFGGRPGFGGMGGWRGR